MKIALADTMTTLPEQLAPSVTWGRGKEMSAHVQFKVETGIPVFRRPHSPGGAEPDVLGGPEPAAVAS